MVLELDTDKHPPEANRKEKRTYAEQQKKERKEINTLKKKTKQKPPFICTFKTNIVAHSLAQTVTIKC